jgi:hypothetical protein
VQAPLMDSRMVGLDMTDIPGDAQRPGEIVARARWQTQ